MQSYRYKMSVRNALSALVIGAGLAAFSIYAIVEAWGISVRGVALPPEKAQYLYIVLAGMGCVVLLLSWMLKRVGLRKISIDEHSMTVPKSELSKTMVTIRFSDIQGVGMSSYNNIHTLEISHDKGKTKVRSPHFESLESFYEFSDQVADAVES